jgi:hypothetical protein
LALRNREARSMGLVHRSAILRAAVVSIPVALRATRSPNSRHSSPFAKSRLPPADEQRLISDNYFCRSNDNYFCRLVDERTVKVPQKPEPTGCWCACKSLVTDLQVRVLRGKRMQGQTLPAAAAAAGHERAFGENLAGRADAVEDDDGADVESADAPFAAVWATEIEPFLRGDRGGELLTTTLMNELCRRNPGKFEPGQVRTRCRRNPGKFEPGQVRTRSKTLASMGIVLCDRRCPAPELQRRVRRWSAQHGAHKE